MPGLRVALAVPALATAVLVTGWVPFADASFADTVAGPSPTT